MGQSVSCAAVSAPAEPMATVMLDQIDVNGKIMSASALQTVKATANHIHERAASSGSRWRRTGGRCSMLSTRCCGARY